MFDMLSFIGIPVDELRRTCPFGPDERIYRSVGPCGEVTLFDEWGGAAIISKDTLFLRYWDGPLDPITEERSFWSIKKICIDP